MSDITVDPRDEFEKVFPLPKHVIRCGKGYACTEYNVWGAHNFIRQWEGWSAAMLQGAENTESLQLRNLIRQRHAEWSQATFGDVGPVGPLKHLSKEALEAAAEPEDLSEWADIQFLLWDAQRRAGITDEQIFAAMVAKLEVNKARTWPEPKDGEPRYHVKGK